MSTICGKINASITKSCTIPLQGGTEDRAWIINKDDVASVSFDAGGEIVENITLNSGANAFFVDGKNNSIEPNAAMVTVGFFNMFDHTVAMKGFDISPEIKAQLNSAVDGKYIVIVENYFKGTAGNSAFEIYGLNTGLEFSEITRNANDEATQGAFHFVLTTKVNKEAKLPNPLYVTSYAATKAIVDGLV